MLDLHLLWGPRPSESAHLKVGDVKVADHYIVVNIPETKTTFRPVPIPLVRASVIKDPFFLDSALNTYMSLMHYLNVHPGYPDHPEYPLWYDTTDNDMKPLSSAGVSAVFRRLGKTSGTRKTVTTYVLRRTAFNRFRGADREKLNAGFGWKPGSRMPIHVYNKLCPQDLLEALINDEDGDQRNIYVCSQCRRENPRDFAFCGWCGAPLIELPASATLKQFHADQEAQKELEELRERLADIEKMMKVMVQLPEFDKLIEVAAKQSPRS